MTNKSKGYTGKICLTRNKAVMVEYRKKEDIGNK